MTDFAQRGEQMVARGQYHEAVKICRLGLLARPTDVEGRLVLGRALSALRRHDEVLAEMRVALEVQPANAKALALRGEALLRKGDARQAVEVLQTAARLDSSSRAIQQLRAEAELAAVSVAEPGGNYGDGASGGYGEGESMTKHYPSHVGGGARGAVGPQSVTRPAQTAAAPGRGHSPTTAELDVGDKSGTIELDPDLDSLEILSDDMIDPPIAPPIDSQRPQHDPIDESDVMELSGADLIEDSQVEAVPVFAAARVHDERTGGGDLGSGAFDHDSGGLYAQQSGGDYGEDEPTVARDVPVDGYGAYIEELREIDPIDETRDNDEEAGSDTQDLRRGARAANAAAAERALPALARRDPSALQRSAAAIDGLFPDDEAGVSRVELFGGNSGPLTDSHPDAPMTLGDIPGGSRGDSFDASPPRSQSADMKLIRAAVDSGVVLAGAVAGSGQRRRSARKDEPTAHVPRTSASLARAKSRPSAASPARLSTVTRSEQHEATLGVERVRRGSPFIYLYLVLALAVGGGSIFVGLKWREHRREQQTLSARTSAAKLMRTDTYDAYLEAIRIDREIVEKLGDSREGRFALARVLAATAAEFGAGRAEAAKAIAELPEDNRSADALAARTYEALARADSSDAKRYAATLVTSFPADPMGAYLHGRAALLSGDAEQARMDFRAALRSSARPAVFVGLGQAEEAMGRVHEALAAYDRALELVRNHPAALISRARVMARAGRLPAGDEPQRSLQNLVVAPAAAVQRVSAEQRAWAALVLADVLLARGDSKGVASALESARANRPPKSWPFAEALIRDLLRIDRLDEAKAEATRAVTDFPKRGEPQVFLAHVAIERRDAAGALAALKRAGDISKDARALAVQGRAYLLIDEVDKAATSLESALALRPKLRAAQAALAEVLLRKGDSKAAVALLEPLYSANSSLEFKLVYAGALRRNGRTLDARQLLGKLEKASGNSGKVLLERARLERGDGKMREAREYYTRAIQAAPADVEPRMEAALLALDSGDRKGAREAFDALLTDAPDDARVLLEAARASSMSGRSQHAAELLARVEALGPAAAPQWKLAREKGRALMKQGMFKAAAEQLEQAARLQPRDGEASLLLIGAYLSSGDVSSARKALRTILKTFRDQPEALLTKGRIDLFNERLDEALAAFIKARRLLEARRASPREIANAAQWIGRAYYSDGNLALARKSLSAAVALDPGHADAHYFLGLIGLDTRKFRQAVKAFRASVEADPTSSPEAWFYLGEAANSGRLWRSAKAAFKKYLELRPKGDYAADAHVRLRGLK